MESPRKSILLVEDNKDDEVLTLRALERNRIGNEVIVARDGVEAVDFLFGEGAWAGRDVTQMPQVVLLDLHLPRLSGFEVLKRIRGDARTRHLPVVALTSSMEDREMIESYELGANSFVRKPVDFVEFSRAVGRVGLYWLLVNRCPLSAERQRPADVA